MRYKKETNCMILQSVIPIGNARIAIWGKGHGEPPVIFLAGGLCDHRSWMSQLLDLDVNRRLLAIDPRGCGMTQGPGPYDVFQQAEDVSKIISTLMAAPAIIVSHSMGGYAALLLNHFHPELVLANVFIDVPLSKKGVDTSGIVKAIQETHSILPLTRMVDSMTALAPQNVGDEIRDMMLTRPVEVASGMLSNLDAVTKEIVALITEAVTRPCLAIWPGPRPLGGDPEWLTQSFPSFQQEFVIGAGHFLQLEQPESCNHLLARFINGLKTGSE